MAIGVLLSGVACEEEQVSRGVGGGTSTDESSGDSTAPPNRGAPSDGSASGGGGEVSPEGELRDPNAPTKERELPEASFIETDENRDPFRSYLNVFSAQAIPEATATISPRPPVLLDDVSLDELRLIAIVSGEGGNPRAMVVDPAGKGWVVARGDYLGRGERVRLGPGQPEREINWRVVRVRPDRIILVREDPVQAGPPVTRIIRLYPEGEDS
jgi:type IV pilus assembly protein PilP